jgi:hypothetical protein
MCRRETPRGGHSHCDHDPREPSINRSVEATGAGRDGNGGLHPVASRKITSPIRRRSRRPCGFSDSQRSPALRSPGASLPTPSPAAGRRSSRRGRALPARAPKLAVIPFTSCSDGKSIIVGAAGAIGGHHGLAHSLRRRDRRPCRRGDARRIEWSLGRLHPLLALARAASRGRRRPASLVARRVASLGLASWLASLGLASLGLASPLAPLVLTYSGSRSKPGALTRATSPGFVVVRKPPLGGQSPVGRGFEG